MLKDKNRLVETSHPAHSQPSSVAMSPLPESARSLGLEQVHPHNPMTRASLGLHLQLTAPNRFRSNFPPLLLPLAGLCVDQMLRRRCGIARHVDNTEYTVSRVALLFLHLSFAAEAVSRRSICPFYVQYSDVLVTAKLDQVSFIKT